MRKLDEFNAQERMELALLDQHVHFLVGEIETNSIYECIRWITYENLDVKTEKVLTLYINSTGGDLYEAFALIDVMQSSHHPIRVIGIGAVMSAAFLIFASGTKGQRYAAKNTSFMCHQFSSNVEAKYHDIKAEMKENELLNIRMIDILKSATGLTPAKIKSKLLPASDVYLTSEEILEFGVADYILNQEED